jgi:Flp pilus assembly protein TadD
MLSSSKALTDGSIAVIILPHSTSVTRVLYKRESGAFVGYRLEVAPVQKKRYRLMFKLLANDIDSELQRHMRCPNCPHPTPVAGEQPHLPATLQIADGGICTLELLVNPQTGEKVVEIVKVASQTVSRETMRLAEEKMREALQHTQRADILTARGNPDGAISEYQKALSINPNDVVVQARLGVCFQRAGRMEQAQRQYELAVRMNPRYAEAWNNLGSSYHTRGEYNQAIKYYQKAIDNKPSLAAAYKNMGAAYFAQGRFEEGYRAFQAAFRIDPAILETNPGTNIPTRDTNAPMQHFYFAKLSAANENIDAALDFLKNAFERGFKDCALIVQDPDFQKVVSDPRYAKLAETVCRK